MNMKDLRDIGLALVLASVMCLMLFGCGPGSASGGVGGQGYAIKDIDTGGGNFTLTITTSDGGTSLVGENPSPAATTQPSN